MNPHILGPKPDHPNALSCQPSVAADIPTRLILLTVNLSIDLHRQPRGGAVEVEDVGSDRMLAPKP